MSKTTLQARIDRVKAAETASKKEALDKAAADFDSLLDPLLAKLDELDDEVEAAKAKGDLAAIQAAIVKLQAYINRQQPVVVPQPTPAPAATPIAQPNPAPTPTPSGATQVTPQPTPAPSADNAGTDNNGHGGIKGAVKSVIKTVQAAPGKTPRSS